LVTGPSKTTPRTGTPPNHRFEHPGERHQHRRGEEQQAPQAVDDRRDRSEQFDGVGQTRPQPLRAMRLMYSETAIASGSAITIATSEVISVP
jgi:hypothetical protein